MLEIVQSDIVFLVMITKMKEGLYVVKMRLFI